MESSYKATPGLGGWEKQQLNSQTPQQDEFNLLSLISEIRHRQQQQEAREADLQEICRESSSELNVEEVNDPGKLYETLHNLTTSPNYEDYEETTRTQAASCCKACVVI